VSYVAPELVLHQGSDARSDVYACGVLLYELLTGRKPHEAETPIQVAYKHVHDDIPPPSRLRPELPAYVDALVARATARDRDQRPPDARVMLRHLRRVSAALAQGLRSDVELTEDLSLRRFRSEPADDDWNAFLFESAATDLEHTAITPTTPPASSGASVAAGRPAQQRRSRRGPIMLAVLLLLAVAAAATGWQLAVGQYTRAPALVGLPLAEATEVAADRGLTVEVGASEYSESAPEGNVITSSPGDGERVLDEGTIEVVVSLGKERYEVPDVEGLPLEEAQQALRDANLASGEPVEKYTGKVEDGRVISTSPEAGSRLKPDTEVQLTISRGPAPIKIPDLRGETESDAVTALEELRFTVATTEKFSDDVALGEVISQSPRDGTGFRGDRIDLVVSAGPRLVEVPDVLGQGVEDATALLEGAGFTVEVLEGSPHFGLGYVTEQTPVPEDSARVGSQVTIYLI
jgi:serine/threonine-protein kinase